MLSTCSRLTDKNLYAYCDNNLITRIDSNGDFWRTITDAIFGAISGGISAALEGKNVWAGIGIGAATGAAAGLSVDLSIATGGLAGVAIAAAGGAIASVAEDAVNGDENDWGEIAYNATFSAATNVLSLGMGSDDGIKTGAKTIKQAFQYTGQNFVQGTIANGAGRVSKYLKPRLRNLAKNTIGELTGSVLTGLGTELLDKAMQRLVGISE